MPPKKKTLPAKKGKTTAAPPSSSPTPSSPTSPAPTNADPAERRAAGAVGGNRPRPSTPLPTSRRSGKGIPNRSKFTELVTQAEDIIMALPPTDNDDLGTYDPRAIWQTGSSLLSAILRQPDLEQTAVEAWTAWMDSENDARRAIQCVPIPQFFKHSFTLLTHLRADYIDIHFDSVHSIRAHLGNGNPSKSVQAPVEDLAQGILRRAARMVSSLVELMNLIQTADVYSTPEELHTEEWISLLVHLLDRCLPHVIDTGDTSTQICKILSAIAQDEQRDTGRCLLADDRIFGVRKLGDFFFRAQCSGMSLHLVRTVIGLFSGRDTTLETRKSLLNNMFRARFDDWTRDLSQRLARLLNKAKSNRLAPKLCAEVNNEAANCPNSDRPRSFAVEDFTIDGDSLIDNEKAQQRALDGCVILYVDRWSLSLMTFDPDGVEAEASFEMTRITEWSQSGAQTLMARLESRTSAQTSQVISVKVASHTDAAELYEVLQARSQGKVPPQKAIEPNSQALAGYKRATSESVDRAKRAQSPATSAGSPERPHVVDPLPPPPKSTLAQDVQNGVMQSLAKIRQEIPAADEDITFGDIRPHYPPKRKNASTKPTTVISTKAPEKPQNSVAHPRAKQDSRRIVPGNVSKSHIHRPIRGVPDTQTIANGFSEASTSGPYSVPPQNATKVGTEAILPVREATDAIEVEDDFPDANLAAEVPQRESRPSSARSASPASALLTRRPIASLDEIGQKEQITIRDVPTPSHSHPVIAAMNVEKLHDLEPPSSAEVQRRDDAIKPSIQRAAAESVLSLPDGAHFPPSETLGKLSAPTVSRRQFRRKGYDQTDILSERPSKKARLCDSIAVHVVEPVEVGARAHIAKVTNRVVDMVLDNLVARTAGGAIRHDRDIHERVRDLALDFTSHRHARLHARNKLFCKEAAKSEAIQESFQRDRQRFAAFDEASRALQHHVDAYIASMASKPALPAILA